jgi:hypothetical protein
MSTDVLDILDKLTNAVSFHFKQDGTKPNVTISKLKNSYYGSVVRYPGKEKKVVCKAESPTLAELIPNLAKAFLIVAAKSPIDPLQELFASVKAGLAADDSDDVVKLPTGFIKYGDDQVALTGRVVRTPFGGSI